MNAINVVKLPSIIDTTALSALTMIYALAVSKEMKFMTNLIK